jgi:hypothetical protein
MAGERVAIPARSAVWADGSAGGAVSSTVRRDRAAARICQGLAAAAVDRHRAPAEAGGTRRGCAAVAGDARVPAVSIGADPGRARRDVVGPVGDLSRDHGEAAAPADLDTGRHSCVGIVRYRLAAAYPPGARTCRWCSRPQGENGCWSSIQRRRWQELSPAQERARLLADPGFPDGFVEELLAGYARMAAVPPPAVTSTVRDITGTPAAPLSVWATEHAVDFGGEQR